MARTYEDHFSTTSNAKKIQSLLYCFGKRVLRLKFAVKKAFSGMTTDEIPEGKDE